MLFTPAFFAKIFWKIYPRKNAGAEVGLNSNYARLCKINGVILYVKVHRTFFFTKKKKVGKKEKNILAYRYNYQPKLFNPKSNQKHLSYKLKACIPS